VPVRIASRRPGPDHSPFEWRDPSTFAPVLDGVRGVYLVAPVGVADPAPLVAPFLAVAQNAGVRRVVLLSSSAVPEGGPGLGELHRMVTDAAAEPTVLRPSWFMQNLLGDHPHAVSAREIGEIVTATGEGRIGFIDAGDIAAVAAHALCDDAPLLGAHVLTGPQALSYSDVADLMTEITGHRVVHRTISVEDLSDRFVESGYEPGFAAVLAALDADIAAGAEDRTTSTVTDVTGRSARTYREVIRAEIL
jgi:uncharacterized protein YbjT (DUF2867 family)